MGCLICEQIEGVASLPGGPLVDDVAVVAYHLPPIDRFPVQYLGRMLVVTRRHVAHIGQLTSDEAAAVGRAAQYLGAALLELDDVAHVHCAVIGLHVPHFHQHVFPRYCWMPAEADWNSLHERVDAPRGGAEEIAGFVRRLRTAVA
jgi:diadenosine tetraphosphate (Ap4A) HIT family hydrolase